MHLSPPPYVLHAPPNSFFLFDHPNIWWWVLLSWRWTQQVPPKHWLLLSYMASHTRKHYASWTPRWRQQIPSLLRFFVHHVSFLKYFS
jgi:hypothetical protein